MKRFANLYDALDSTRSTLAKVEAMVSYFRAAPSEDSAWALFLLMGRRLKRLISPTQLAEWTRGLTGLPAWLMEESYAAVGDLAETTALLLDRNLAPEAAEEVSLSQWITERLLPLKVLEPDARRQRVQEWWVRLPRKELFLLNKMLTGELRVGVSDTLVVRAVSQVAELPPATVAHRLMGQWEPSAELFRKLLERTDDDAAPSRPYPFYLASPLEDPPASLGPLPEWQVEWKWDGIRAQLLRRAGQTWLWSRGEELITDCFPEVVSAAASLPEGSVLDGEVLAFSEGAPLPFSVLQRRIGRQKLTAQVLAEAPVVFMAFDLLEAGAVDLRERPLRERREALARMLDGRGPVLQVSPAIEAPDWDALATLRLGSRERAVEGLMLKRLDAPYRTGRKRGEWWKWKIDPYTVDAVLVYAHPGNGRRANLFTDYTFAVWKDDALVPVAKAYSGLTDEELGELDRWVRAHTSGRFGPVRVVEPSEVFELHFEGIAASSRHKAGLAIRFPRIARRRLDKTAAEADRLEQLQALLKVER